MSRVVHTTTSKLRYGNFLRTSFGAQTTFDRVSVRFMGESKSPYCPRRSYICLISTSLPFHTLSPVTSPPTSSKGISSPFGQFPIAALRIKSTSIARYPSTPYTPAWRRLQVSFAVSVDGHSYVQYHRVRLSYKALDIRHRTSSRLSAVVISPLATYPAHLRIDLLCSSHQSQCYNTWTS